jgi:hypothetical protein
MYKSMAVLFLRSVTVGTKIFVRNATGKRGAGRSSSKNVSPSALSLPMTLRLNLNHRRNLFAVPQKNGLARDGQTRRQKGCEALSLLGWVFQRFLRVDYASQGQGQVMCMFGDGIHGLVASSYSQWVASGFLLSMFDRICHERVQVVESLVVTGFVD